MDSSLNRDQISTPQFTLSTHWLNLSSPLTISLLTREEPLPVFLLVTLNTPCSKHTPTPFPNFSSATLWHYSPFSQSLCHHHKRAEYPLTPTATSINPLPHLDRRHNPLLNFSIYITSASKMRLVTFGYSRWPLSSVNVVSSLLLWMEPSPMFPLSWHPWLLLSDSFCPSPWQKKDRACLVLTYSHQAPHQTHCSDISATFNNPTMSHIF